MSELQEIAAAIGALQREIYRETDAMKKNMGESGIDFLVFRLRQRAKDLAIDELKGN